MVRIISNIRSSLLYLAKMHLKGSRSSAERAEISHYINVLESAEPYEPVELPQGVSSENG